MISTVSSHLGAVKSEASPCIPHRRNAQAEFSRFLLSLPVPLALLTKDQRVLKCNDALQRLLGISAAESSGRRLHDVLEQRFVLENQAEDQLLASPSILQCGQQSFNLHLITPPRMEVADVPVHQVVILQQNPPPAQNGAPAGSEVQQRNRQLEQQLVEVSTRLALLEWSLQPQPNKN